MSDLTYTELPDVTENEGLVVADGEAWPRNGGADRARRKARAYTAIAEYLEPRVAPDRDAIARTLFPHYFTRRGAYAHADRVLAARHTEAQAKAAQQVRDYATGLSTTLDWVEADDEYNEGVRAAVTEVLTSLSELADLIEGRIDRWPDREADFIEAGGSR